MLVFKGNALCSFLSLSSLGWELRAELKLSLEHASNFSIRGDEDGDGGE